MSQSSPSLSPSRASLARFGGGLLATVALITAGIALFPSEHISGPEIEATLEDPVAASAELAASVLARAEARWQGQQGPALEQEGPPLWLCRYGAGPAAARPPRCARGDEDTLGASVDTAVSALLPDGSPGVFKLDYELARREGRWPDDADKRGAGTFGMVVGEGYILPSEFLERDLFFTDDEDDPPTYQMDAIRELLKKRGADLPKGDEPFSFVRLRTASWVPGGEGQALRTYRVHAYEDADPSVADLVLTRAVQAAEHLSSLVAPDGRIRYRYRPGPGKERKGQNLLRHAGSTYSLVQAYARTRHEPWRQSAARALEYLLRNSASDERTGPYGGGKGRYIVEGRHIKLGGAGLALVALTEWQAVTGSTEHAASAREFATFLLSQQQQSGEFVYFAPKEPGGEPRDDTSAYYPGEAILGLVSWYALDPDPRWLETAKRGADWLIDVRDKGKGPKKLANDHWLMIALDRLHEVTKDPRYLEHAQRLAAAVAAQHEKWSGREPYYRDYQGGYYDPPRATPASTRAEGLVAVITLLERNGVSHELRPLLLDTVRHLMRSQYTLPLTWWMAEPSKVVGGFAGGIVDTEMRNDYTQHALSALLGTERLLGQVPGEVEVEARLAR